jgi:hypothetical protein
MLVTTSYMRRCAAAVGLPIRLKFDPIKLKFWPHKAIKLASPVFIPEAPKYFIE